MAADAPTRFGVPSGQTGRWWHVPARGRRLARALTTAEM
jgi:hypothetical protein